MKNIKLACCKTDCCNPDFKNTYSILALGFQNRMYVPAETDFKITQRNIYQCDGVKNIVMYLLKIRYELRNIICKMQPLL